MSGSRLWLIRDFVTTGNVQDIRWNMTALGSRDDVTVTLGGGDTEKLSAYLGGGDAVARTASERS